MGKTENNESVYPKTFRVVSVTSGKGGMGKTNITVNLGLTLAKGGRKVLLMDADLGLANVDVVLGVTPKVDLRHVIFEGGNIEDCITHGPEGVDILSGTSGVSELTHLDTEQKWALLEALEPLGDRYDTLLIDTAAGIGSNVQFFTSAAQEVVLVVGHEPTSLTDAYSTVKVLANKCGVRRVLVCVNRTTSLEAARDVFRQLFTVTTRFLNVVVEFVGWIPNDPCVEQAVMKQEPFVIATPMSPASQGIKALADSLLRRQPAPGPGGGFQVFWRTLLGAQEGAV
jgi:flagellar biosynthesis protein FlhG